MKKLVYILTVIATISVFSLSAHAEGLYYTDSRGVHVSSGDILTAPDSDPLIVVHNPFYELTSWYLYNPITLISYPFPLWFPYPFTTGRTPNVPAADDYKELFSSRTIQQ